MRNPLIITVLGLTFLAAACGPTPHVYVMQPAQQMQQAQAPDPVPPIQPPQEPQEQSQKPLKMAEMPPVEPEQTPALEEQAAMLPQDVPAQSVQEQPKHSWWSSASTGWGLWGGDKNSNKSDDKQPAVTEEKPVVPKQAEQAQQTPQPIQLVPPPMLPPEEQVASAQSVLVDQSELPVQNVETLPTVQKVQISEPALALKPVEKKSEAKEVKQVEQKQPEPPAQPSVQPVNVAKLSAKTLANWCQSVSFTDDATNMVRSQSEIQSNATACAGYLRGWLDFNGTLAQPQSCLTTAVPAKDLAQIYLAGMLAQPALLDRDAASATAIVFSTYKCPKND